MGVIGKPHGVRGHLHVHSYAERPEDLAAYTPLLDNAGRSFALQWVGAGIAALTELTPSGPRPITDRTAAERLTNTGLHIDRTALAPPGEEEFYLSDLIGLAASDRTGACLGTVAEIHDYGAGISLEIATHAGPLIVPFTRASVPEIDLAAGTLILDPPADAPAPRRQHSP